VNQLDNILKVDNVILGDNQFFGVNHMSMDKGNITKEQFKDVDEIKKVICYALDRGVKGVFFSTHPLIEEITDIIRRDSILKKEIAFYVNVPYIVKYISMVNAMGIEGTVKHVLRGRSAYENISLITRSIGNLLTLDYMGIANKLIDIEMRPFYGLNVKAVFLHNTLCDLCLGYDLQYVVQRFDRHIKKRYQAIPAYGTLNLPRFSRFLEKSGIYNSLIMTAINKKGFFMNPSVGLYEEEIASTSNTILAMSTLASGSLKPNEAYAYLKKIGIKHIVVGLSSQKHADETFSAIKQYIVNS
jgi:hypothetical protein